jgi:ComF family protein
MTQIERAALDSLNPGIFAAFVQEGPLKSALHRAKFGADQSSARALGRLLGEVLCDHSSFQRVDCVVPVPLHLVRLRERGYNQAHAIARELGWPVCAHALRRTVETSAQARLNREARQHNVEGAFSLADSHTLRGKTVLLVDDVTTTGATLRAAKTALERANVNRVLCVAVAQAVLHNTQVAL